MRCNRLVLVWTCVAALAVGWLTPAPARADEVVDVGTKKLMAANGLSQRQMYREAAAAYEEFLKQYPTHPDATAARYALAVCRFRLGEFPAAGQTIQDVLKDPKFDKRDEALAVLGHCQLSAKSYPQALAAFDELLSKHAESKHAESAAIGRVQVLYLLDRKADCAAAAEDYSRKYPDSTTRSTAIYFLALSQRALGKDAEAAKTAADFLKAYPTSPRTSDVMLLLGQSLEAQGKLVEAIAQYRQMAQSAPADRQGEARYSLGAALYKKGEHDEAIKELTTACGAENAKSPSAAPARLQLGAAQLAANRLPDARATLGAVVQNDPVRAGRARYLLAQCDMAEKKWDIAATTLLELTRMQPPPVDGARLVLDRAVCLLAINKPDQATGELADLNTRYPASDLLPEGEYRHAFALHKAAKYDRSHKLCQKIIAQGKTFAAPAADLDAENLFLMGKYAEAAKAYKTLAPKDDDRKLRVALRLGQCSYLLGDYAAAIELLRPVADSKQAASDEELMSAILLLGDAQLQAGKFAESAQSLSRFVAGTKKDNSEALYKLAVAQLRGGDTAAAEKTLGQLATGSATSPWVIRGHFEAGQLAYKQKQFDKAAVAMEKVLSAKTADDLTAPAIYMLGWIHLDAKRYPDAIRRFGELLERFPKHSLAADALFQQAAATKDSGNSEGAAALFQKYINTWPAGEQIAAARQLLAASWAKAGKPQLALDSLRALAADKKTRTDSVLYDLAWAQRSGKDDAGAAQTYQALLAEFPASTMASTARAELAELLYAREQYAEAADLLKKAIADTVLPRKVGTVARYRLAWCHEKLKQPEQAAAAFAAFAQQDPGDELVPSALYQAGAGYAALNRLDDAQKLLAALLSAHPGHALAPAATLKLAEVQSQAGGYEAAQKTYQQYLERFPRESFAHLAQFGIGWSLEQRKKYPEARQWYEKVTAGHNGPTAARAQFQIGETYYAERQYDKAVPALLAVEDVYAYREWSARALLEAGRAMEQLKDVQKAKAVYRTVMEKYKDLPEAEVAGRQLKLLGG